MTVVAEALKGVPSFSAAGIEDEVSLPERKFAEVNGKHR
jgi:hypothetical protein